MTEQHDNPNSDANEISQLYRSVSTEQPSPSADQAILELARQTANRQVRRRASRFSHWAMPASVAAVVVLSVSIVTVIQQEATLVPETFSNADSEQTEPASKKMPLARNTMPETQIEAPATAPQSAPTEKPAPDTQPASTITTKPIPSAPLAKPLPAPKAKRRAFDNRASHDQPVQNKAAAKPSRVQPAAGMLAPREQRAVAKPKPAPATAAGGAASAPLNPAHPQTRKRATAKPQVQNERTTTEQHPTPLRAKIITAPPVAASASELAPAAALPEPEPAQEPAPPAESLETDTILEESLAETEPGPPAEPQDGDQVRQDYSQTMSIMPQTRQAATRESECAQASQANCLQSTQCTLVKDTTGLRCRPVENRCEEQFSQTGDDATLCTQKTGCDYRPGKCTCTKDDSCECGPDGPPLCMPAN